MSTVEQEDRKLIFEENEKVLCYHGPLIYEAKVRRSPRVFGLEPQN